MALDRTDIIEAAIMVLDELGLEGVTTRAVASKLGIAGPSLYWHFRDKQELLDHMAEHILAETLPSPDPQIYPGEWQTWLAAGARSIRQAALAHRDGARAISRAKPTGAHPAIRFPAMLKRLEDAGFSRSQASTALMVLGRFALGWALDEQNRADGRAGARVSAGFEFGVDVIVTGIEARLLTKRSARRERV
jgi:TetR/AcrR family transcriptional regulator, tetracycline repressor protein